MGAKGKNKQSGGSDTPGSNYRGGATRDGDPCSSGGKRQNESPGGKRRGSGTTREDGRRSRSDKYEDRSRSLEMRRSLERSRDRHGSSSGRKKKGSRRDRSDSRHARKEGTPLRDGSVTSTASSKRRGYRTASKVHEGWSTKKTKSSAKERSKVPYKGESMEIDTDILNTTLESVAEGSREGQVGIDKAIIGPDQLWKEFQEFQQHAEAAAQSSKGAGSAIGPDQLWRKFQDFQNKGDFSDYDSEAASIAEAERVATQKEGEQHGEKNSVIESEKSKNSEGERGKEKDEVGDKVKNKAKESINTGVMDNEDREKVSEKKTEDNNMQQARKNARKGEAGPTPPAQPAKRRRREEDQEKRENSERKERPKENTLIKGKWGMSFREAAKNSLVLTICGDGPLDTSDLIHIQAIALRKLYEAKKNGDTKAKLAVDRASVAGGSIRLLCSNQATADWLVSLVPKIEPRIPGNGYRVYGPGQDPLTFVARITDQASAIDPELFSLILRDTNEGLPQEEIKLLGKIKNKEGEEIMTGDKRKGVLVRIRFHQNHLSYLKEHGFNLLYGLGRIELRGAEADIQREQREKKRQEEEMSVEEISSEEDDSDGQALREGQESKKQGGASDKNNG